MTGLILAAGASRRMGFPKPLLELEGETFLDRLVGAFEPSCDPILVVVGFHADRVRNGVRRTSQVRFVENPDPDRGMLSSLQCGLREVPETAAGVIFTPVDYPQIRPATVAQIADSFLECSDAASIIVPTCDGQRGHPVCVARPLFSEFLELPLTAEARLVVRRHRADTSYVEVGDPGILRDVDKREDYRKLVQPD